MDAFERAEMVVLWLFAAAFALAFGLWFKLSLGAKELLDVPNGLIALLALVPVGKALETTVRAFYKKVTRAGGGSGGT
jgi:hypothetical protein